MKQQTKKKKMMMMMMKKEENKKKMMMMKNKKDHTDHPPHLQRLGLVPARLARRLRPRNQPLLLQHLQTPAQMDSSALRKHDVSTRRTAASRLARERGRHGVAGSRGPGGEGERWGW